MDGPLPVHWDIVGVTREILKESSTTLFSYFLGAEKVFNDRHSLSLATWGTPTERGQQMAATEEAYYLANSHYYNPNWGYQNGEKRNARIVRQFEPSAIASWNFTIDDNKKLVTSAGFKYSNYGKSALGWNGNAADPRPDYYKNCLALSSTCGNPFLLPMNCSSLMRLLIIGRIIKLIASWIGMLFILPINKRMH